MRNVSAVFEGQLIANDRQSWARTGLNRDHDYRIVATGSTCDD